MAQRKSIDCRSLRISGTEQEVLDAAVQHAVSAHGHERSQELREQLKAMLKGSND
jgi:predicted small metal-binding protein